MCVAKLLIVAGRCRKKQLSEKRIISSIQLLLNEEAWMPQNLSAPFYIAAHNTFLEVIHGSRIM